MNQSTTTRGVPFHRNPELVPAVNALSTTLFGAGYHEYAREKIVRLAWITGDPTASVELCDEDEAEAVDAWIEGLPEVPYSSDAWSVPDVFLDVELMANGTHPFPMGPEQPERDPLGPGPFILLGPDDGGPMDPEDLDGPDAPDDGPYCRFPGVMALPPIRGGSDEAEPFEPSAEDLADYHSWSEDLDRRRAAIDRHSPEGLALFSLALYGRSEPFHA